MTVYTAKNVQRVYSLLPFSATVTVTTLPVASEKSNGNVTVGLVLLQYREVQYLQYRGAFHTRSTMLRRPGVEPSLSIHSSSCLSLVDPATGSAWPAKYRSAWIRSLECELGLVCL
jgi:hypothetical protein